MLVPYTRQVYNKKHERIQKSIIAPSYVLSSVLIPYTTINIVGLDTRPFEPGSPNNTIPPRHISRRPQGMSKVYFEDHLQDPRTGRRRAAAVWALAISVPCAVRVLHIRDQMDSRSSEHWVLRSFRGAARCHRGRYGVHLAVRRPGAQRTQLQL
ncbi:hypothetical protein ACEPAI_5878 [Sanghuangporus weigelae]